MARQGTVWCRYAYTTNEIDKGTNDEQLEQALGVAEKDTKDASAGVMKDLRRFQSEKEDDLRRYMVCFLLIEVIVSVLTC